LLTYSLPEGWIDTSSEGVLECQPAERDGAAHITFLRVDPDKSDFRRDTALAFLESFERTVDAAAVSSPRVSEMPHEIRVWHSLQARAAEWRLV
jgi:hypothetical protein